MELERRRGGEMSETHVHLEMNSDFFSSYSWLRSNFRPPSVSGRPSVHLYPLFSLLL